MPTAVIVDDEINGAESLSILVKENCPEVKLVSVETDPDQALAAIRKKKPDILFLDIEMPGMTGFELLSELDEPLPKVIFTTAYSQYAIHAFRHNAIDYLLKPVIVGELIAAVNKLKEKIRAETLASGTASTAIVSSGMKLTVTSQNEILHLDTDQIIRLEADSNYTNIYMKGGRKIISAKTLKEYEELLTCGDFFRVHKTNLVNLKQIEKFMRGDNAYLLMKDNSRVEVSRRKKADFLLLYNKSRGI